MTARVELLIYWRVYIIINPFISIIIPYKTVLFPYKSHIPKDYLQGMLIPNLLIPKCGDFHLSLGDSTVVSKNQPLSDVATRLVSAIEKSGAGSSHWGI